MDGNSKDYFSRQSSSYARFRPGYPEELFEFVASLAPRRGLAWDCATGNGQAALGLAPRFGRVVATDMSRAQLDLAPPAANVEYRQAGADSSGLEAGSVDLTTVAQALHWFDFHAFFAEVRRVSVPGAALAAWCYGMAEVTPPVDALVRRYYDQVVGPYWPKGREHVDLAYRGIPFPFEAVSSPEFSIRLEWGLEDLLGYLSSWSATQRYREARGDDPMDQVGPELARVWGPEGARRTLRWPLTMLAGRVS